MRLTKEEVNRKLLHILSGTLIPAGIFYIPKIPGIASWVPGAILGVLTALFAGAEMLRRRLPGFQRVVIFFAGSMMRPEEDRAVTGATYIFASAFLCTVLFAGQPHISFMVLSMFIIGDAAAALVGLSIGRIRIGAKSLEGSLACLATCLVLLLFAYPHVPGLLDAWEGTIPIPVIVGGALSTTVLELFPISVGPRIKINDNLTVPVVTGLVMQLLYAVS